MQMYESHDRSDNTRHSKDDINEIITKRSKPFFTHAFAAWPTPCRTDNNFLANYEIVIRARCAYKHRNTPKNTKPIICRLVRTDVRPLIKWPPTCESAVNNEQKSTIGPRCTVKIFRNLDGHLHFSLQGVSGIFLFDSRHWKIDGSRYPLITVLGTVFIRFQLASECKQWAYSLFLNTAWTWGKYYGSISL